MNESVSWIRYHFEILIVNCGGLRDICHWNFIYFEDSRFVESIKTILVVLRVI